MRMFFESICDVLYTLGLWFGTVVLFFVGLFLMGLTFKFIANVFMAGYHIL